MCGTLTRDAVGGHTCDAAHRGHNQSNKKRGQTKSWKERVEIKKIRYLL